MTMKFSHSGKLGDALYSIPFCRACLEKTGNLYFKFNLQKDVKHVANVMERENVMLTEGACQFLKPLLEWQPFIEEVTISSSVPCDAFDLSIVRKQMHNFGSGDIRLWYQSCVNDHLDIDLTKPSLEAPFDDRLKDKIIICMTERYVPAEVDMSALKEFASSLVFIGTDFEHQRFCSRYFGIERVIVKDALELAGLMKGCKCVISNLNGNYAIGESLKCKRICLMPDLMKIEFGRYAGRVTIGPMNVIPQRWLV